MMSSKRLSTDRHYSEVDLKKVKVELEVKVEVEENEEKAAVWSLKNYKIPKKGRTSSLEAAIKEESPILQTSQRQQNEDHLPTCSSRSSGSTETEDRTLSSSLSSSLGKDISAKLRSRKDVCPRIKWRAVKKLEEYKLKEKRGSISHSEMEFLKDPGSLLDQIIMLDGLKKKRQRHLNITPKEKMTVLLQLQNGSRPRGSVDNQHLADSVKVDYHKVKYQVGKFYEKKFEETGEVVVKEKQMRPRIKKSEKKHLVNFDRSSRVMPSGACDRHRIATTLGIRRDQADNHYRKH